MADGFRLWLGIASGALALGAAVWAGPRLFHMANGERDWSGEVVYEPPYPVRADALEDIDFAAVHGELMPVWQSRLARHGPDATSTRDALHALELAVAPDANLTALVQEMATLAARPSRDPDRLLYLTWAWSTYLDRAGLPWVVQGSVRLDADGGGLFYTKNYEVVADLDVRVGEQPVRARLVERVDSTNVVERYLGQVSDPHEGALIVVDRVREVALDVVWPLLDPASEDPHADAVQEEALGALSREAAAVLVQAAGDRAALVSAVGGIRSRRACGSRFVMPSVPWDGYDPTTRSRLFDYAEASTGSRCPTVTHPEAVVVDRTSQSLQEARDLEDALQELVAWVARGVVVHEARHVADGLGGHLRDGNYGCLECEDGLSEWARAEASAYLASASEPGGAVALAEMCGMVDDPVGLPAHYQAAVFEVVSRIAPLGCEHPPTELIEQARRVEEDWFARDDRVTFESFPDRLRARARALDRYRSFPQAPAPDDG
ncbi:MAG: hypothetical protein EP330_17320 [Deltaproteobacteria bacterium]|nr:MAG: hypothetical protein EP330_17320 [Deltaproteobacteria bacterium]